jgi:hypothetical protein
MSTQPEHDDTTKNQDSVIFEDLPEEDTDKPKDPKQQIDPADAQKQLDLLLSYYEIYPDDIDDADTKSMIKTTCNRVKRAIINGRIEVEKGEKLIVRQRTFETENKTTFEYGVVGAKVRRAMTGTSGSKRMCIMMSSLSGLPENVFAQLEATDMSTMENLATIFLLV